MVQWVQVIAQTVEGSSNKMTCRCRYRTCKMQRFKKHWRICAFTCRCYK